MTLPRWLILIACIVLFCGGLLHLIGSKFLIPDLVKGGVDPAILGAVKAVWFAFSVEFVVLTPALVWISGRTGLRSLLLYLSLIPATDCILMYHFVGLFIGTYIVAAGSLLLVIGGWLLPRGESPPTRQP